MFLVDIQKNQVKVNQTEPLTSGSSRVYLVYFNFSEEWQDLARIAVFNVGDTTINVLLDEKNVCFIPWEVLTKAGVPVRFGVYGTRDGDVVLPTIWAQTPTILQGVVTGIDGQEPTPDVYQQLLGRLEEILDKIDSGGSGSGEKGDPGATFFPTVSEDGVISWTNNGNLPNPDPVDIRGPKGEGVDLVAGQGIEIADDTISVELPTKALTQAEYDALSEEERERKVFLITDCTQAEVERVSVASYRTDDNWYVRKWSDGFIEMILEKDVSMNVNASFGSSYCSPLFGGDAYPVPLLHLFSQNASVSSDNDCWCTLRSNPDLEHVPQLLLVRPTSKTVNGTLYYRVTGLWK